MVGVLTFVIFFPRFVIFHKLKAFQRSIFSVQERKQAGFLTEIQIWDTHCGGSRFVCLSHPQFSFVHWGFDGNPQPVLGAVQTPWVRIGFGVCLAGGLGLQELCRAPGAALTKEQWGEHQQREGVPHWDNGCSAWAAHSQGSVSSCCHLLTVQPGKYGVFCDGFLSLSGFGLAKDRKEWDLGLICLWAAKRREFCLSSL